MRDIPPGAVARTRSAKVRIMAAPSSHGHRAPASPSPGPPRKTSSPSGHIVVGSRRGKTTVVPSAGLTTSNRGSGSEPPPAMRARSPHGTRAAWLSRIVTR